MEDMADEYIRQRNPNGIYVAVPHFDKDHYHIHICASGVEYKTWKSFRLSKTDFQKLKKEIQNYQIQKFPELSKSIVTHGKKGKSFLTEKEYQLKLRTGRETIKEHVMAMLISSYKKANSRDTFFEVLNECNLKTYERNGQTTGVVFNGHKFRFNRIGFTEEKFNNLARMGEREKNVSEFRNSNLQNKGVVRSR